MSGPLAQLVRALCYNVKVLSSIPLGAKIVSTLFHMCEHARTNLPVFLVSSEHPAQFSAKKIYRLSRGSNPGPLG